MKGALKTTKRTKSPRFTLKMEKQWLHVTPDDLYRWYLTGLRLLETKNKGCTFLQIVLSSAAALGVGIVALFMFFLKDVRVHVVE